MLRGKVEESIRETTGCVRAPEGCQTRGDQSGRPEDEETRGRPEGDQRETRGRPEGDQRETRGRPERDQRETRERDQRETREETRERQREKSSFP